MRWFSLRHVGFAVAPLAWAISTQFGQILPYIDCRDNSYWSLFASTSAAAVAAGGVIVLLWRSRYWPVSERIFGLCGLAGLAFVFALLLQGAAPLLLNPCDR